MTATVESSNDEKTVLPPNSGAGRIDPAPIPGIVELRSSTPESTVCRPALPEASKEEIRISSSLCVDHLCGCNK